MTFSLTKSHTHLQAAHCHTQPKHVKECAQFLQVDRVNLKNAPPHDSEQK